MQILLSFRLDQVPLDEFVQEGLAQGSGAALDNNTSRLESGDLRVSATLAAADDGSGVTHTTARGSANAGDETNGGLVVLVVGLEELGSILLGATTDLTNHDDTVGLLVLEEDLQAVDEVGAGEGVTTDTDDQGLTKTSLGGLVDGLVGQGTGPGHNTDTSTLVNESRHDTNLALALHIANFTINILTPVQKDRLVVFGCDLQER